jgi:hypothetical protein
VPRVMGHPRPVVRKAFRGRTATQDHVDWGTCPTLPLHHPGSVNGKTVLFAASGANVSTRLPLRLRMHSSRLGICMKISPRVI